jgi:hypothetical protein
MEPAAVATVHDRSPSPTASGGAATPATSAASRSTLLCPFDLALDRIDRFLNGELVDDPVYDGFELQWFDDEEHGRGMLAFLSRRDGRLVDYYAAPRLRLDRTTYEIGGGTGVWTETDFEADRLEVGVDGVRADVRFHDREGRPIVIEVDDREAGPRRTGELLAPVGAGIDAPASLLLIVLHGFDLVRRTARAPRILIDGREVGTGTLPGAIVHRRHLIKAAAPLVVSTVCPVGDRTLRPVDPAAPGRVVLDAAGRAVAGITTDRDGHTADLSLAPPLPALADLPDGDTVTGVWRTRVDGRRLTGGSWHATRRGEHVDLGLDVTDRWRPPAGLPPLQRVVTRLVPTFRRWPTTYRWRAEIAPGPEPRLTARWERIAGERGEVYRRVTGSGGDGAQPPLSAS